ncbi:unnamed protein product [Closterium sp. Naga37s-1]|nr:unnamed protein product [Closterium sp. Naga37s-1]
MSVSGTSPSTKSSALFHSPSSCGCAFLLFALPPIHSPPTHFPSPRQQHLSCASCKSVSSGYGVEELHLAEILVLGDLNHPNQPGAAAGVLH